MEKEILSEETRRKLKDLSKAFLRLHKTLLDGAKTEYEARNGKIANANHYFSSFWTIRILRGCEKCRR